LNSARLSLPCCNRNVCFWPRLCKKKIFEAG
jgi:hypothetical protein